MAGRDRRLRRPGGLHRRRRCCDRARRTPDALRPLANAARLTGLPEYIRAVGRQHGRAVAAVALLTVLFARPIARRGPARPDFPPRRRRIQRPQPEDIMLCVGARHGSGHRRGASLLRRAVDHFGTERIGLTSPNRRVVPLTRDYQYARQTFRTTPGPPTKAMASRRSRPQCPMRLPTSVEDLLALCLTGFPDFDQITRNAVR